MPKDERVKIQVNVDAKNAETALKDLRKSANKGEKGFEELNKEVNKLEKKKLRRFKDSLKQTEGAMVALKRTASIAIAAIIQIIVQNLFNALSAIPNKFREVADEITVSNNRFALLTNSVEESNKLTEIATQISKKYGFSLKDVANTLSLNITAMKGQNGTLRDAVELTDSYAGTISALGLESDKLRDLAAKTADALQDMSDPFAKLRSSFSDVSEFPELLRRTAERELGRTITSYKQLSVEWADGTIGFKDAQKIFKGLNKTLRNTPGVLNSISDEKARAGKAVDAFVAKVAKMTGFSDRTKAFYKGIADNTQEFAEKVANATAALGAFLLVIGRRKAWSFFLFILKTATSRITIMSGAFAAVALVILANLDSIIDGYKRFLEWINKIIKKIPLIDKDTKIAFRMAVGYAERGGKAVGRAFFGNLEKAGENYKKYLSQYFTGFDFSKYFEKGKDLFSDKYLDKNLGELDKQKAGKTPEEIAAEKARKAREKWLKEQKRKREKEEKERLKRIKDFQKEQERVRKEIAKREEKQRLEQEKMIQEVRKVGTDALFDAANALLDAFESGEKITKKQILPAIIKLAGAFVSIVNPAAGSAITQVGGIVGRIANQSSNFNTGGYTGSGSSNQIAGLVHKNEFVLPPDVTRKMLDGVPVQVGGNASPEVTIVNVASMDAAKRYMESTDGTRTILNVMNDENLVSA